MEKADSYVIPNAYPELIEANGGVGLNAGTGEDSTNYFYNFPRNRLELWFLLESQRFYDPVFREFYKERDVVREERRMRVESSPQGQLVEALLATAFAAHPYRNMPGGWASDIENFRLTEAMAFYKKYYVPANITIGIAGDVDPKECRRLADKYFSILPAGPLPSGPRTVEPVQKGEKRVEVESPAQPFMAIAYKRPDQLDKDDPVFDVLGEILAGERTGLLYTDLVRDKKIALGAAAEASFPGGKYPNLFLFFLVPNQGHTRGGKREGVLPDYRALEDAKGQRGNAAAHQNQSPRGADPAAGQQLRHGGRADVLLRQLRRLAQTIYQH